MSKLKDTCLMQGGANNLKPIGAYGSADRPDPGSAKTQVPRDGGMLSNGTTGGNFALAVRPNGPGPRGTQDVADDVGEAFGHPVTSIL